MYGTTQGCLQRRNEVHRVGRHDLRPPTMQDHLIECTHPCQASISEGGSHGGRPGCVHSMTWSCMIGVPRWCLPTRWTSLLLWRHPWAVLCMFPGRGRVLRDGIVKNIAPPQKYCRAPRLSPGVSSGEQNMPSLPYFFGFRYYIGKEVSPVYYSKYCYISCIFCNL